MMIKRKKSMRMNRKKAWLKVARSPIEDNNKNNRFSKSKNKRKIQSLLHQLSKQLEGKKKFQRNCLMTSQMAITYSNP